MVATPAIEFGPAFQLVSKLSGPDFPGFSLGLLSVFGLLGRLAGRRAGGGGYSIFAFSLIPRTITAASMRTHREQNAADLAGSGDGAPCLTVTPVVTPFRPSKFVRPQDCHPGGVYVGHQPMAIRVRVIRVVTFGQPKVGEPEVLSR
jgi:hypothetical protein